MQAKSTLLIVSYGKMLNSYPSYLEKIHPLPSKMCVLKSSPFSASVSHSFDHVGGDCESKDNVYILQMKMLLSNLKSYKSVDIFINYS